MTGCGSSFSLLRPRTKPQAARKETPMDTPPTDLHERLRQYRQEHVFAWWDRLTAPERHALVEQLRALDLDQLRELYAQRDASYPVPPADRIAPAPVARLTDDGDARRRGEELLRQGKVAVLLVAGGQGSRLGFDQPKGMYPIG